MPIHRPDTDRKKYLNTFRVQLLATLFWLCWVCPGQAAYNDWAEGTQTAADGATRDYYNRAGRLEWEHYLGDWRDANDTPQGDQPYATADIQDNDTPRYIEWDVRELLQAWVDGTHPNQGFFIHAISGAGPINFRSREVADTQQRPQLLISAGGGDETLSPVADTYLEPSTYRSMGDSETLTLRPNGSNHCGRRRDYNGGPPIVHPYPIRQHLAEGGCLPLFPG
ncbi:MAG: disaggregatase related repeat-containing protein [Desulfosarcinaceae bacterium]